MATGRPRPSATASGSWPGATSNQFCPRGLSPRRKSVTPVFNVDHSRDELAVAGQLQVFLSQFDGNGEVAILVRTAHRGHG